MEIKENLMAVELSQCCFPTVLTLSLTGIWMQQLMEESVNIFLLWNFSVNILIWVHKQQPRNKYDVSYIVSVSILYSHNLIKTEVQPCWRENCNVIVNLI